MASAGAAPCSRMNLTTDDTPVSVSNPSRRSYIGNSRPIVPAQTCAHTHARVSENCMDNPDRNGGACARTRTFAMRWIVPSCDSERAAFALLSSTAQAKAESNAGRWSAGAEARQDGRTAVTRTIHRETPKRRAPRQRGYPSGCRASLVTHEPT